MLYQNHIYFKIAFYRVCAHLSNYNMQKMDTFRRMLKTISQNKSRINQKTNKISAITFKKPVVIL